MAKKNKTKAEKVHMNKVASLGCIACRVIGYEGTPPELHHIRANAGVGQKSSNYDVIPLCAHHHRIDKNAIHQSKVNFEADFGTELELLEMVKGLLNIAA
jgi:hypothetical protein